VGVRPWVDAPCPPSLAPLPTPPAAQQLSDLLSPVGISVSITN